MHIWKAVYFPSWRSPLLPSSVPNRTMARYYQRKMDEKRIFVFITHYHALWVAGPKKGRNNKPKSEWSHFLSFSLGLLNLSREKLEREPHFVCFVFLFFFSVFYCPILIRAQFSFHWWSFCCFLFFLLNFYRLPTTDGRVSKKSDTVDTLLYYFSPLFAVMVPLRYDLC